MEESPQTLKVLIDYVRSKFNDEENNNTLRNICGLMIQPKNSTPSDAQYFNVFIRKGAEPYRQNDFDILLIYNPETHNHLLYFIPMDKLIEHGCICHEGIIGKYTLTVTPNEENSGWTTEFLLNINDPYLDQRIVGIYRKQKYHLTSPLELENYSVPDVKCKTFHQLLLKWNIPFTFSASTIYKYFVKAKKIQEFNFVGKDYTLKLSGTKYKCTPQDFNFGCFKIPGTDYIYIIPMQEFINNKIIKYDDAQREIKMPVDINFTMKKYLWIKPYLFDFNDPEFKDKFIAFIDAYHDIQKIDSTKKSPSQTFKKKENRRIFRRS